MTDDELQQRELTFCVLEQGKTVQDPLTIAKRRLFDTPFSRFVRLNWKTADDPLADFVDTDCCWSEGRSLLFEKAQQGFDYYIFIDEDVSFHAPTGVDIARAVQAFLKRYRPLTGTFFDPTTWPFRNGAMPGEFGDEPHPICSYDLELHFFSRSFAQLVFPVPFHGSDRSMHYSHWLCYTLFPRKQVCFFGVEIRNNVHEPHGIDNKHTLATYGTADEVRSDVARAREEIVDLFNGITRDKSFDPRGAWAIPAVIATNRLLRDQPCDPTPVEVSLADLARVVDVQAPGFFQRAAKRRAVADDFGSRNRRAGSCGSQKSDTPDPNFSNS
jgi:hypothetical protein